MSNEIKCKECGYENPRSSKFCNNCGTKLPLATHIFCPNCNTPNTRDRIFCDTCGTRLVPETIQPDVEPPQESAPPVVNEPFSLPARRPGDTGELNPNAVPDWLRTGEIGSAKLPGADEPADDDVTSQGATKGTQDLPDWLVHDSDPEPIVNAPTTISTEFYQDLLEKSEDLPQPDDLFADEDEASLPDWLSEADETTSSQAADDSEASSGLTDWLSELSDESGAEDTAVSDDTNDASDGLTDWLHELDDLSNPAEAHAEENAEALENLIEDLPNEEADSSDWLRELGPVQTDIFEPQTDDLDPGTADDLPGWMDELGPLQTNLLDPSQIAELSGPLTGFSDDADMVDDAEAGADASFTDLFETASETTETLPDWLDAAAEDDDAFLTDLPDDLLADEPDVISEAGSDWFTAEQIVAETDLDWLEETGNLETVADDAPLGELESTDMPLDEAALAADELDGFAIEDDKAEDAAIAASDDDFDWLSDMEAIQAGDLVIEPEPEDTPLEEASDLAQELPDEPEPDATTAVPVEEDSWSSDGLLDEGTVGEDLPDWLSQLDEKGKTPEADTSDSASEELPEWIASMRPSEGFLGSELPGVFADVDLRDTLEGIPEELAGAELPDWLQDTPLDGPSLAPFAQSDKDGTQEIPDWLQPDAAESETAVPTPSAPANLPESSSSRNEWSSLLEELPPLTPFADSLAKAEIPEWVQQLKPPELTGEMPRDLDGPEETAGPLKGMHGIVPIEPAIARPRVAEPHLPYVTTPEQLQQVALLRQISQESSGAVTSLATKTTYRTAVWLRITVGLLLIVALLFGLRGPSFLATELAVSANVQAVNTAVTQAAGQPVLLAIEYTPAMAAELSPQAEMLLTQLAANDSPVLIISQYAAGTAVATNLVGETGAQMVGYLPGEGIGLRQLGDCLANRTDCAQLNGRFLTNDLRTNLSQAGLVIVLTGDRDNLVNWIEQVGSVATNVPVVAGVTQALTPLANSYTATGQLTGLLGGIPDAVAYEQLLDQPKSGLHSQLNAQIVGQLLAAALLLVGLLVYGTTGLLNSRRQ